MAGWVYIMTNKRNGTLYVGVTGGLVRGGSHRKWRPLTDRAESGLFREHHEDVHGNPTRNQPQALAPHLEGASTWLHNLQIEACMLALLSENAGRPAARP